MTWMPFSYSYNELTLGLGGNYAALNPQPSPLGTDDPKLFLNTLYVGNSVQKASEELESFLEDLDDAVAVMSFSADLLKATYLLEPDYREKQDSQYLSSLVELGRDYASLNPFEMANSNASLDFFPNTLWEGKDEAGKGNNYQGTKKLGGYIEDPDATVRGDRKDLQPTLLVVKDGEDKIRLNRLISWHREWGSEDRYSYKNAPVSILFRRVDSNGNTLIIRRKEVYYSYVRVLHLDGTYTDYPGPLAQQRVLVKPGDIVYFPANELPKFGAKPPDASLRNLNFTQRLLRAVKQSAESLGEDFKQAIQNPEFLTQLAIVAAAFVAIQSVPILNFAVTAYFGSATAFNLIEFLVRVNEAQNEEDLRAASEIGKSLLIDVGALSLLRLFKSLSSILRRLNIGATSTAAVLGALEDDNVAVAQLLNRTRNDGREAILRFLEDSNPTAVKAKSDRLVEVAERLAQTENASVVGALTLSPKAVGAILELGEEGINILLQRQRMGDNIELLLQRVAGVESQQGITILNSVRATPLTSQSISIDANLFISLTKQATDLQDGEKAFVKNLRSLPQKELRLTDTAAQEAVVKEPNSI